MVVEILNNKFENSGVSINQLHHKLAILKDEWSRVEVYANETYHSPFDVLIEQVKREIRNCGFTLDEDPGADSIETLGDHKVGMWIFYCSPKVLVVVHFNNQGVKYDNGDVDVRITLTGIQVIELE